MNIVPISSMAMLQNSPIADSISKTAAKGLPFQSIFEQALRNVEETDAVKRQDSINLAMGNVDNLAQIGINSEKATLAVQTMVELRNRVLEAYNEIMRLNV